MEEIRVEVCLVRPTEASAKTSKDFEYSKLFVYEVWNTSLERKYMCPDILILKSQRRLERKSIKHCLQSVRTETNKKN